MLFSIILAVLLAINMVVTAILATKTVEPKKKETVHYTVYIGLNDKVTYEQVIPTDEAKKIVDRVCTKYIDRFAAHNAVGAWGDENGNVTHENTIICYFDDINEELLHSICDELLKELNQNAILIQKEYTKLNSYKGK